MRPSLLRTLSAFGRDRRGNVALLFACALVVLCGGMGFAIDYTNAARHRSKLQAAADEAALVASRAASTYISDNGWSTSNAGKAATAGIAAARAAFGANMEVQGLVGLPTITPTMTIPSAQSITANVTAAASVPTSLMQVFGFETMAIDAEASAVAALPVKYYQFLFLIDISGSMAIGGTSAEIAKMQSSKTFNYCGFACHDPNLYHSDKKDYRALAKKNSIKLKIDYVNDAVSTFLTTLDTALTKASAQATTSIYTYATSVNTLVSSTTSMATAISKAATVDIEAVGPANTNWGYTKSSEALTTLKGKITNVGDGSTTKKRKTYVVFISDGLQDTAKSGTTYGRTTDVNYSAACTAIKAVDDELTLITVEPVYPVVPNDDQYTEIVKPYADKLGPTMKACASSATWAFQAEDGPGIVSAMTNAVTQITSTIRIAR